MKMQVVGERSVSLRRWFERTAGGIRSANADMSNVKAGEKPARRKPKVSCSTFIMCKCDGGTECERSSGCWMSRFVSVEGRQANPSADLRDKASRFYGTEVIGSASRKSL